MEGRRTRQSRSRRTRVTGTRDGVESVSNSTSTDSGILIHIDIGEGLEVQFVRVKLVVKMERSSEGYWYWGYEETGVTLDTR